MLPVAEGTKAPTLRIVAAYDRARHRIVQHQKATIERLSPPEIAKPRRPWRKAGPTQPGATSADALVTTILEGQAASVTRCNSVSVRASM
jgi:hypothetical protein